MPAVHHRIATRLRAAYGRLVRPLTVGVRGLVLRGDDVLLVRHTYMDGWYFPGGGVDKGETVEAALRRELFEEVGVEYPGVPFLVGVFSNIRDNRSDHVLLFRVEDWSMDPKRNHEIAEHGFYSLAAPPSGTSPGTLRRMAELRGEAQPSFRW